MQGILDTIISFIESLLAPFMPTGVYDRLTFLYDASLLALAGGVILLLLAVICVILTVILAKRKRGSKKSSPAVVEE